MATLVGASLAAGVGFGLVNSLFGKKQQQKQVAYITTTELNENIASTIITVLNQNTVLTDSEQNFQAECDATAIHASEVCQSGCFNAYKPSLQNASSSTFKLAGDSLTDCIETCSDMCSVENLKLNQTITLNITAQNTTDVSSAIHSSLADTVGNSLDQGMKSVGGGADQDQITNITNNITDIAKTDTVANIDSELLAKFSTVQSFKAGDVQVKAVSENQSVNYVAQILSQNNQYIKSSNDLASNTQNHAKQTSTTIGWLAILGGVVGGILVIMLIVFVIKHVHANGGEGRSADEGAAAAGKAAQVQELATVAAVAA